jgi:hypothetical protein
MLGSVFESAFEGTLKSRVHFQQAFARPVAVALVARLGIFRRLRATLGEIEHWNAAHRNQNAIRLSSPPRR